MGNEHWHDVATEREVRGLLAANGVDTFYLKALSRNHNSKNQIYLAPDLSELSLLPMGTITSNTGTSTKPGGGGPIYHAPVPWLWVDPEGLSRAPSAQLIYYPQYPEVRLSGLLQGSPNAPRDLLSIERRGYEDGRLLIFGSNDKSEVIALMLSTRSPAAHILSQYIDPKQHIVSVPVDVKVDPDSESTLLDELARIHRMGWLESRQLRTDGTFQPCRGPRCGGHTLEANLGISMNGKAAPDFGEWEVKSHKVANFSRPGIGRVTLFTPEPDAGAYWDNGVGWFAQQFGRLNAEGTRFDFTGVHAVSANPHPTTSLRLSTVGYDRASRSIAADGLIALSTVGGDLVSGWTFAKLLQHWQRKHALAAYVPVISNPVSPPEFSYGNLVHLARHTRFEMFLRALDDGLVVYDPGIKSELQRDGSWKPKARSQFRINFRSLDHLYEKFDEVDVLSF
jgi:hypothetical protein